MGRCDIWTVTASLFYYFFLFLFFVFIKVFEIPETTDCQGVGEGVLTLGIDGLL